jgi:hypothetical protein
VLCFATSGQQWQIQPCQDPSRILQESRSNENIIITHTDKNLGPVGVNTEKYVRWAIDKHLLDASTYIQEREEVARTVVNDLFTEIYQWT